jgi:16S rRNA (adenine1518-N6/adenine1519-N6)-dimethyltransferase
LTRAGGGRAGKEGRRPRPSLPPARRSLGQHFLVSDRAATTIAEALGEISGRTVLEIGPGRGILTAALLRRGASVVGLELDPRLAAYLRARFADPADEAGAPSAGETRGAGSGGLEVVEGDVLDADLAGLARDRGLTLPWTVAGNIPYGITSPLLRKLLAVPGEVETAVLMVQREVAQRLLAAPGGKAYGALTVGVGAVADVEGVLTLSPSKFRPPPRVWSTVVRIRPRPDAPGVAERAEIERVAKALFGGRRKQLRAALRRAGLVPEDRLEELEAVLGAPLTVRPEDLPVEAFVRLVKFLERGAGKSFQFST